MSIPKEPRQIMINLMYLVLTALLALNVSAEILHAFHVVNSGISDSVEAINSKNDKTFAAFEKQMQNDPERTRPFMEKAMIAKKLSDELFNKIEALKKEIVVKSGGLVDKQTGKKVPVTDAPLSEQLKKANLFDDRNLDIATNIMVLNRKGHQLQADINKLRQDLLALVEDPAAKKELESQMPLIAEDPTEKKDGVLKNWAEMNFELVPTIAAITLLNKFQNDIRNSESLIIDYLYQKIKADIVVVDKIQAKVIAASNYVMAGQTYKADIFVAAYSSTVNPKVWKGPLDYNIAKKDADGNFIELTVNPVIGGGTPIPVSYGMGKLEMVATGEGIQKYSGAVEVQGPDGNPRFYPFEAEFQTAKGAAVIASENLNIIYAGIPNPFSVSVPGFPADKVQASVSAGQFVRKSPGKYDAVMDASLVGKKVNINVSVQTESGIRQIGSQEFVIKRIPDPQAQINGVSEGKMPASTLKVAQGIGAVLKDFYFQGVKFEVTSYEVVYIPRRQDPKIEKAVGARFTGKVAEFISNCKPGDTFIFRSIKAKGPDGTTRSLNSIPIEIT
ncbi:MAG: hypothetical protein NZL95_00230 [Chitinophagales bacterium]|nr:hypothetical protein [Chitinophagales bacterium]MDW8426967.1 GldM family protein [Chitinophagales bacterium]